MWPFLMLHTALAIVGYQQSPGRAGNYWEFIGASLCLGAVIGVPALLLWSWIVYRIFGRFWSKQVTIGILWAHGCLLWRCQ